MASTVARSDEDSSTTKPVSRKERVALQIRYLVRAVPSVPNDLGSYEAIKSFLLTCSTITLGASRIFERIDLGDDLDASLHGLVLFVNSINDHFLSTGKLPKPDSLQQIRAQLYQFFCTFHETLQRFK